MKKVWDKGDSESHVENLKNGQTKSSGQVPVGPSGVNIATEHKQSANPSDPIDKKPFPVGSHPSVHNPLLLNPAGLQLAQLQAQLTLHRLKLAQTAVSSNTAAAASVLNQVLSNVAMSQPLFNQLRTPAIVHTPQGHAGGTRLGSTFPPNTMPFTSQGSVMGNLGSGGGFQSGAAGGTRFSHFGGQQISEYSKKPGPSAGTKLSSETNRRCQYGFPGGTSVAGNKPNDSQFVPLNTKAKGVNPSGFQRDFFGPDSQGPSFAGEHNLDSFQSGSYMWQNAASFSQAGNLDTAHNVGTAWTSGSQQFLSREELYNPEEPTTDPKFNPVSGPGFGGVTQGFVGYQPGEEAVPGVPVPLLPHQLNDFHAVAPENLPHQCTICDKKVYNLKDWDQHVKGKLHLQKRSLYLERSTVGSTHFPASSEGCVSSSVNNPMAYSTAVSQDASSGPNSSYCTAAPMKTHPVPGAGHPPSQTGSKFPARNNVPGRVVHICNLPEGSCTENDVINLGLPFGKVTNYILMRSTHQAFLEMAYVEAAQAMVQFYQLHPAMISDQKLLIRMSKRYKELQLKARAQWKDVEAIIQDINSQREREELQEIECYPPERARSRSPISRSLSPRSHSPSFTSCSSVHSPPVPCRGDWANELGPRGGSWDWSSHVRREEERDGTIWRNEDEDRPNGRLPDRRKLYHKLMDRMSPRLAEDWAEGMRGIRDWGRDYPRGSPQGQAFLPRNKEEDFYKKEPSYKSEKAPRTLYQRHELPKLKKKEAAEHHRSRRTETEGTEDLVAIKTPEDRKHTPPTKGKQKKTTRKQKVEKDDKKSETQGATELQSKDKSESLPQDESERDKESGAEEWGSGDENEEEFWYPRSMEELVTVDEIGEEDDSMVEPALPNLQEEGAVQSTVEGEATQSGTTKDQEKKEIPNETTQGDGMGESQNNTLETPSSTSPKNLLPDSAAQGQPASSLSDFPSQEFQVAFKETLICKDTDKASIHSPEEVVTNHTGQGKNDQPSDTPCGTGTGPVAEIPEAGSSETPVKDEMSNRDTENTSQSRRFEQPEMGIKVSWEQDKVFSEHSIPLGVEFIVPRSGFYCKLCDLFYTNEEMAKTSHCRSTVHYRNLQKYLSQLAEQSLLELETGPSSAR
ncbi:RNA-binding protein 20 [Arapaima gigas]